MDFQSVYRRFLYNLYLCSELHNQSWKGAVPRIRVPFRLLRRRDRLPQIPDRPAVLQRLPLLLVCQLRHGYGTDDPGRGLRLVLLGLQEAGRHACLPSVLCTREISQVCAEDVSVHLTPYICHVTLYYNAIFISCFRYHTGTLAFGSLILSIIQIIRVLLEYLDHKLKGLVLLLTTI